jgi:predicted transposase/invertase (TIGR01784 family)
MCNMAKLEYTLKTDTLFKMLFVRHQDLLRQLVAALLGIRDESIGHFEVTNAEMPADVIKGKFCRLDINMKVDGRLVNLEMQVDGEDDYRERALFYWARMFSSALRQGQGYGELPRTVVISIIDFNLFDGPEFHSEFRPLETTRHEELSDRMSLHFFELGKVPSGDLDPGDMLRLWLWLFKATTEEELARLKALEVPVVEQVINAYTQITSDAEFREIERQRQLASHNEASALKTRARQARDEERTKWQGVVADRDARLADMSTKLADRDAENERLRAQIAELQAGPTPGN